MVDEQKLRQLADQLICHSVSRSISEVEAAGEAIKSLLDELQAMREERTAWRVTAENAEAAVKEARIDALEDAKQACTNIVDRTEEDASKKRVSLALATDDEVMQLNALRHENAVSLYNCGIRKCAAAIESLKEAP